MNRPSRVELVYRFFPGTGPTYDRMAHLCTLGFDGRWKQRILETVPENSKRIMDQACGTGILTFKLARRFPHSRITGVDLQDEYLAIAKKKAKSLNLGNVEFVLGKAEEVVSEEGFDCITSSYLAKYADLGRLIRNVKEMLRGGGILIMHDFTYPSSRTVVRLWEIHFMLLQKIGSAAYPQWKTIFYGLPALIKETTWVTDLTSLLKENGFADLRICPLTLGTSTLVVARKN